MLVPKVRRKGPPLSQRERRVLRGLARSSPDGGLRCRCKIVLSLAKGNGPPQIQSAIAQCFHEFLTN